MTPHVLETVDSTLLGERLADARRSRQLTQRQVADVIGVARTTVVAIEKGERRPRASELHTLARLYGRAISEFVRPDAPRNRPNFVVQFAAVTDASRVTSRGLGTDLRRFESLCRWYVELEDALGSPLPRRYPAPYDISGTPIELAAAEVAGAERNRLGLGDGPTGNLWGLLETDVGLRVFDFSMSDERNAGLFVFSEEYGGCIAVNADHSEGQRRLSAAHCLGHFLTDRYRPDVISLERAGRPPDRDRFADAFARNFLMPAAGLQRRFEAIRRSKSTPVTPTDVLSLSHLYGVSAQTMTSRLEELKLLPARSWDVMRGHHKDQKLGLDAGENQPIGPGPNALPIRYVALSVQAFMKGLLSEGQLAERLLTDRIGARGFVSSISIDQETSNEGRVRPVPFDLSAALLAS